MIIKKSNNKQNGQNLPEQLEPLSAVFFCAQASRLQRPHSINNAEKLPKLRNARRKMLLLAEIPFVPRYSEIEKPWSNLCKAILFSFLCWKVSVNRAALLSGPRKDYGWAVVFVVRCYFYALCSVLVHRRFPFASSARVFRCQIILLLSPFATVKFVGCRTVAFHSGIVSYLFSATDWPSSILYYYIFLNLFAWMEQSATKCWRHQS